MTARTCPLCGSVDNYPSCSFVHALTFDTALRVSRLLLELDACQYGVNWNVVHTILKKYAAEDRDP